MNSASAQKQQGRVDVERFISAVLVALLAWFLYCFIKDSYEELFLNPVHFFDDAYMFIRYARIWHLGYGEAWNIGEGPVYGNTSQLHFLFVLLLTSFSSLGNDMVVKLASYIPSFLLMCYFPCFCARHTVLLADQPFYKRCIFWAAIVCPFIYWQTPYAYHFLTGMDTALSTLMHLVLIDVVLSYARQNPSQKNARFWLAAIALVIYLCFATRPENLLPCGLFVLLYLVLLLKQFRQAAIIVASVAVLVVLDSIFKYYYFGDFVPLAFYSKKVGYLEGFAAYVANHPLLPVSHFLVMIWPMILIYILGFKKEQGKTLLVFILPVVFITLYFLSMMSIMNIRLRYEYPFVIYLIAAVVVTFKGIDLTPAKRKSLYFGVSAALALLGVLLVFRINSAQIVRLFIQENPVCNNSMIASPENFNRQKYKGNDGLVQMSDYLHKLPAGTKVVMTEHGYVGANNPQINIIDVIGLHSRYIAHNGFSADWLFAQQPDAIWVPHWNYTCLNQKIFSRSEFWDHYTLYPLLFNWGIALRRDSPKYAIMHEELEKTVKELYPEINLAELAQTKPLDIRP